MPLSTHRRLPAAFPHGAKDSPLTRMGSKRLLAIKPLSCLCRLVSNLHLPTLRAIASTNRVDSDRADFLSPSSVEP